MIARLVQGRRMKSQRRSVCRTIYQELEEECAVRGLSIDLAVQAGKFDKEIEVPEEYRRHARIFDEVESKKLPPSRPWDHAINLKPDAPDTIDCKIYPLPPKDDEALKKWLAEEEEKGYIRPSISPIASSFFFLQKADGKRRPVQDYQGINAHTIQNCG